MKPRNKKHKLTEAPSQIEKPRFKIEKLEERIAPRHACRYVGYRHGHFGKFVGHCN